MRSGLGPLADASAATLEVLRLLQEDRLEQALGLYRALVGQKISDPETLHRLGFLAIQFGEFERAQTWLRAALSAVPDHPWYCNTLGIALRHQRNYAAAVEVLQRAIARVPDQHELWSNLGNALRDDGRFADGAQAYRRALTLAPEVGYYWSAFSICLRRAPADVARDAAFVDHLIRAIAHPEVSPEDVAPAALHAIKSLPAMQRLIEITRSGDAGLPALLADPSAGSALDHPLLLRLLAATVVADVQMERMLTQIRRCQLLSAARDGTRLLSLEAATGIARQCFLNEYAWFESAEEAAALDALVQSKPDASGHPLHLAVLAAYRPLTADSALGQSVAKAGGPLADLFQQQIAEPADERRLLVGIRVLAPVATGTSGAVREQYESNPYPRWSRMGRFEHALPVPAVLGALFPGRDFSQLPRAGTRILVAGCGTGRHAIQAALRFADARVLAFDLSRSSLGYAARKTREMGLTQIEYCQGDILGMDRAGGQFDVIESVGVLHHLQEPMQGWRALLQHLAHDGVMRIGLYSERARRHVVDAQNLARVLGTLPEASSLRRLRRAIIDSDDVGLQQVTRIEDFYNLSGCRDLLLHVQEHRFTPADLAAMLAELDLEFLGFELPDPAIARRYLARFPEDAWLTRLENWEELERHEPDTFFGMYDFWVRRKTAA
jgi:2-polyprenyl-3-methyl-5-hydroxy-6-metoxy-1,4-benzoquinol methylase/tetratricopeptide (TPR) repeat protein